MNGVQELKKQAAAAKRAAASKTTNQKQKRVKWQTGKYTYKWVTPKQAKLWGTMRSEKKKKEFREARKKTNKIRKVLAWAEKIRNQDDWILDWDAFPYNVRMWKRDASDNWITQNNVFVEDNINVTQVFWYQNEYIGPDVYGHDNEDFLKEIERAYPEEWRHRYGTRHAAGQERKYRSGKLEDEVQDIYYKQYTTDVKINAGRRKISEKIFGSATSEPFSNDPFASDFDYTKDLDLSKIFDDL